MSAWSWPGITLTVTAAATVDPVSPAEAMLFAKVDDTSAELETLFASLISSATQYAQSFTNRQFISATFRLNLDRFSVRGANDFAWTRFPTIPLDSILRLPRPPLASVSSVKYYDLDNVQQTLSAANYQVDTASEPGRLAPTYGNVWPSTYERFNAIEINYVAGYGATPADVPDGIRTAICRHVAFMYDVPDAPASDVAPENMRIIDQLLWPYRTWWIT